MRLADKSDYKREAASEATARKLGLVALIIAAAIVVLVPVILDPQAANPSEVYDPPKFKVLMGLSTALLVMVLGLVVLLRKPFGVPVLVPALAFLGVSTLSAAFSGNALYSLSGDRNNGLLSLAAGVVLFYALARVLNSPLRVRVFLTAGVAAAVLVSIYGILQNYGLDPIWGWGSVWPPTYFVQRPFSTSGNSLFLAAYLTLMMGAAIALCFKAGSWGARVPWLLALAVIGACWIYTGARGAMLGLGLALLVVLWLAFRRMRTVRPLLIPLATLAVAMVAAIAAAAVFGNLVLLSHVTDVGSVAAAGSSMGGGDKDTQARLYIWRDTVPMILDRPLLGYGPDNFAGPFKAYEGEDLKAVVSDDKGEAPVDRAHNEMLQVAATTGLLGLAAYVWIFVSYFRNAYRRGGWPLIALSGGVLAYIIQLQTVFSTIDTNVVFWGILGASVAVMRIHDRESGEPNQKTPEAGGVDVALTAGTPGKITYELLAVVIVGVSLIAIAVPTFLNQRENAATRERAKVVLSVAQTVSIYEQARAQGEAYPEAGVYTAADPIKGGGTSFNPFGNVTITTTTTPTGGFTVEGESITLSGTFEYSYDSATDTYYS